MGGKGGGRIGRCGLHAHEQGGEADKGGCRGAGIGAPGARHVGEHVVVRALEGDAPLFVVAEFLGSWHNPFLSVLRVLLLALHTDSLLILVILAGLRINVSRRVDVT